MRTSFKEDKPAILGAEPLFREPVPITEPTIPSKKWLMKRCDQLLSTRFITNARFVKEFEKKTAGYLGVRHAIALNSCTTGLILALKCLGVRGKAVLPSFTFCATGHSVIWAGLEPVFVDCDPETFNIDPCSVEAAITDDVSCIIGVHVFGNPANIQALEQIARKTGVKLIFDAAHGFGSKFGDKNIGIFGDAEIFSLSPTKLLTTGEGGLLTTNNNELAEKIRIGRNYGMPPNYDCEFFGLSARMSELNAILGCGSLRILDHNIEKRYKLAKHYREELTAIPGISFQSVRAQDRCSYKDFSVLIEESSFGLNRDRLALALEAEGVITRKYFDPPLHRHAAYSSYSARYDSQLECTNRISANILCLPLYSHMDHRTVDRICAAVRRIHLFRNEINSGLQTH